MTVKINVTQINIIIIFLKANLVEKLKNKKKTEKNTHTHKTIKILVNVKNNGKITESKNVGKRMEKDRHYRAYDGLKAANNGNTSSLKRSSDVAKAQSRQVRCLCFGGVPDKASHHSFLKGFMINLGICALLVAYTLLGSFIFLAIEGGADGGLQQRTLATTIASGNQPSRRNTTAWLNKV